MAKILGSTCPNSLSLHRVAPELNHHAHGCQHNRHVAILTTHLCVLDIAFGHLVLEMTAKVRGDPPTGDAESILLDLRMP